MMGAAGISIPEPWPQFHTEPVYTETGEPLFDRLVTGVEVGADFFSGTEDVVVVDGDPDRCLEVSVAGAVDVDVYLGFAVVTTGE